MKFKSGFLDSVIRHEGNCSKNKRRIILSILPCWMLVFVATMF